MKLFICSDLHGDLDSVTAAISAYKKEGCERMLILGDLLYHGPRNDLPKSYAPKAVIELLNNIRDHIITVRGNCDTEVDQMVLNFPILQDFAYLFVNDLNIVATHGHNFNPENPPALRKGDILFGGHTHVLKIENFGDENLYLNPGSVSLPKENNPKTYAILDGTVATIKDFDGRVILSRDLK